MVKYTPMIEQYLQIKKNHQDCLLLFRLGDFYEMFFSDAEIAARELEIVLTARDGGGRKVPMCGVPYHAVNSYIARLLARGYSVAICDQVEDPKQAKGIVKREVTRIITPGTVLGDLIGDEDQNNYLAAVVLWKDRIGFAYIDVSTGEFNVTECDEEDHLWIESELQRVHPAECLIVHELYPSSLWQDNASQADIQFMTLELERYNPAQAADFIKRQYELLTLEGIGLGEHQAAVIAVGAILAYLEETQKTRLIHIQLPRYYSDQQSMRMDTFTRRNLELVSTLREDRRDGSLLGILDFCLTAMGRRMLRKWIEEPLIDEQEINKRLDAVEQLHASSVLRKQLRELLAEVYDLERLAGKLGSGIANPRDLLALQQSLQIIPALKDTLSDIQAEESQLLYDIADIDDLAPVTELIAHAIDEEAPITVREGGIIKAGFHEEIDALREIQQQGNQWLISFEAREKERTGMKFLKVGYNKVFGYYLEVSKSNLDLVPPEYIRKQTLVNTERFITEELKEYEDKLLRARENLHDLEYQCFQDVKEQLLDWIPAMLDTAQTLAQLDVLASLAEAAFLYDYTRPSFNQQGEIKISGGRHPVVECNLTEERFVPNDLVMDNDEHKFAIITGPNMGGKSTFMRQVALIVIMAQMGSFVPADKADLCLVDRVFTRVGASDDLSAGQSTFMVEMVELANILLYSSLNSLIILDEIGRGTSTYDGLCIAQAVCEYIHDQIGAKTLFATHYHEVTALADEFTGIFNLSVSVIESGDTVTFLKRVLPGKADKSYGIHVAKLAGIPSPIIERANELLASIEQTERVQEQAPALSQGSLFIEEGHWLLDELQSLDLDDMSPKDALDLLYNWKQRI